MGRQGPLVGMLASSIKGFKERIHMQEAQGQNY